MQLILVRHAQPVRVTRAEGVADPELSPIGIEQAERVPAALSRHRIDRILSSPQSRARQTAAPLAAALGHTVDVVDDLAEYDRDLPSYIPIEDAKVEFRAIYERVKAGHLPEQIDAAAFTGRVLAAIGTVVAAAEPEQTVVAFAHGGVINVLLQDVLGLARPLTFPIDYCSITRILFSRTGRRTAATVNENGHVWDLLPRNIG
ncbi:histidine phosphatase family protein [Nocardia panacis]|uniref:Histidine phosphatase family protein n=1 Tax=Nocardia panacis TaxID=2340916 RepID=A0A3A4KBL4_9NOCA|nr:histidine phosphatase family protein [Nocardia panacis]RJO77290.1 histidine phosphatase family protein [Nocardia panacis]